MIATNETTVETVAQRLATCLPDIKLERGVRPTALPIDSLDLVAFLCAVDQEFGVRISAEEFQTAASVDALFEIIAARSGATDEPSNRKKLP